MRKKESFSACRRLKFFVQYPDDVVDELLDIAEHVRVKAGSRIFKEGDTTEHYIVIVRGSVKIER